MHRACNEIKRTKLQCLARSLLIGGGSRDNDRHRLLKNLITFQQNKIVHLSQMYVANDEVIGRRYQLLHGIIARHAQIKTYLGQALYHGMSESLNRQGIVLGDDYT